MPAKLEKSSHCKVNLLLNILGKREDGFHELETVMQPVGLSDRMTFARGGTGIVLSCDRPGLPTDSGNLAYRAAEAFCDTAGVSGVQIGMEKRIPLEAGLGGGSGNAATTLAGLNELFGRPLPVEKLVELASGLGSDVPFFLQSGPALATGRGEKVSSLEPFPALDGCHILLIHPGFGVSTAWAYKNLARFPKALHGERGRGERLVAALRGGDLGLVAGEFYNSLEFPVLEKYPLLALLQEFLRAEGADVAMMSGSGSTTFAIVRDPGLAKRLERRVKEKFGEVWTACVGL